MTPRELVLAQFPGKLHLGLCEAGAALGLSAKTSYNLNSLGKFPVPVKRVGKTGRMPVVAVHDIIVYLEGGTPIAPAMPAFAPPPTTIHTEKRGPGRPTKREARERAERLASFNA